MREDNLRRAEANKVRPLPPVESSTPIGSLTAATHARLEAAGLLDDPSGVAALILAAQIDARADSGASMAALVRQHAASMTEATGRAAVADDPLDELARRRDAKRGSA